jgi:CheY-like chemotaxis protein
MARILIVDDEQGIREFLVDVLASDGHETVQAADATEALGHLRTRTFDLMITDVRMPGTVDGVDLLRRARGEQPAMEVILLTAHGTVETAVRAMKFGAFDYLQKPIGSPGELRMLVWSALERRTQCSGPERPRRPPLEGADAMTQLGRDVERALGSQYDVEALIGRGGYAAVFRVYDRHLDRKLAVKALLPELAGFAEIARRFRCEALTAARLSHPNIVPIYFVGREAETPCLVMPLVEGESLSARLRRDERLGLGALLSVASDVAGALDFAHRAGVVHRDVKPDNILVESAAGRCLLTDFGIAKAVASGASHTAPGYMVGTPHYASPEQAASDHDLDGRSDLYSLAVVVYEMLAGRPPFGGRTAREILARQVTATVPPLLGCRPEVGPATDRVMAKALAKDPSDRFSTGAELVGALRDALEPSLTRGSGNWPSAGGPNLNQRRSKGGDGLAAGLLWVEG